MKISKIALACSFALASMSVNAANTGIPLTPDNVVFISGASGVDSYLGAAASSLINVSVYVANATSAPTYQAWYGTTKKAIGGLSSGSNLLIIKRSAGGSSQGVIPLALGQKIETIVWTDGTKETADGVVPAKYTASITTAQNGRIPDLGVSDVEPKMFTGINAEFGYTPLTAAQRNTLTSAAWAQLGVGIAANKAVPETQVLSNNFVRSALAGHIQKWVPGDPTSDPIIICRRIEGSGTQAAFNSYFSGFPNVSAYNGYQYTLPKVTSNSLGFNAAKVVDENDENDTFGTGSSSTDPIVIDPNGYMYFEGSASSDVRKCLQAAQMGKDVTLVGREGLYYKLAFSRVKDADGNVKPSKAIGLLTLDSYTSVSTTSKRDGATDGIDGLGYSSVYTYIPTNANNSKDIVTPGIVAGNGEWNFRNLNGFGVYDVTGQTQVTANATGVEPSRVNLLNNSYDFSVEPTLQYKTETASNFIKGFYVELSSILGNPVDMKVGSANNLAPLAYVALPDLYTKDLANTTEGRDLVADLTRQGNTTAPLHIKQ